jgi:hypothetical protein
MNHGLLKLGRELGEAVEHYETRASDPPYPESRYEEYSEEWGERVAIHEASVKLAEKRILKIVEKIKMHKEEEK